MGRMIFLIGESLVNLRRNALVATGAILAVFISLTLAFGALVVNELLRLNTIGWQQGTHIIAFLKDSDQGGLDAVSQVAYRDQVMDWEEVETVHYVDKAGAYEEFKEIFASRPELIDVTDPLKLPASLRIELQSIDLYRDVQFRLAADPVVREVRSFGEQIEQLSTISRVLNVLGWGLSLVLGLSAIILISNTISLAIYARRNEVSVMKLVGASNWFIRVPFLLEGLIEGVVGAVMAVLTVWLAARNLNSLGETIQLITLNIPAMFFFRWGVVLVLFGATVGVAGSLLGLSRHLREVDS